MRRVAFSLALLLCLFFAPQPGVAERASSPAAAPPASPQSLFEARAQAARELRAAAEGDPGRLEAAVAAFREAQESMPDALPAADRERFVADFAEALAALGFAGFDEHPIEESVGLLDAVLTEERRARDPEGWADVQVSLGNTYWGWAAWDNNVERAQLALGAFEEALTVRTRERDPLAWANIQNAIGAVYTLIGATEAGTDALDQAIAAYGAALTALTRDTHPADWAATTGNLAGALGFLARRLGEPQYYRQSLALMQEAHGAVARQDDPVAWATSLLDVAQTAAGLAEMTGEVEPLNIAARAYDEALTELTLERDGLLRAQALNSQGLVLIALGQATGEVSAYDRAAEALRESLVFWRRENDPQSFATINWLIGDALLAGGRLAEDSGRLRDAAGAYRDAQSLTPRTETGEWAYLGYLHATAVVEAALAEADAADLPAARQELEAVLAEFLALGLAPPAAVVAEELCAASAGLGELSGERQAFEAAAEDCLMAEERLRGEGSDESAAEARRRREAAEAALAALG
jgi:tetratricopeptide (TPR) repeat protein